MIAFQHDGSGAVSRRWERAGDEVVNRAGVIAVGHLRKLADRDPAPSNVVDVSAVDLDALLAAPLWQLKVVAGIPTVDGGAVAPTPVAVRPELTTDLEAAIDATIAARGSDASLTALQSALDTAKAM
jgi:hypothetical protein